MGRTLEGALSRDAGGVVDMAGWLDEVKALKPTRKVLLATDCDGCGGLIAALQMIGVSVRHIFGCDMLVGADRALDSERPDSSRQMMGHLHVVGGVSRASA